MRFLTTTLVASLAAAVHAQLPALGTSILTPLSGLPVMGSAQGAAVGANGGIAAGQVSGSTSSDGTSVSGTTSQNQVDVNSLFINTQDICIYQNMKQAQAEFEAQKLNVTVTLEFLAGLNNGADVSVNGTAPTGQSDPTSTTTAMLTPIGNGFWSFANTAHSPPAVSDLLATEVSADLYVPSFMSTFFTNYNSHAPQDIIEILSINNVHIHNFNIQPLLEFDIQFQAQPQAQAQLNGFVALIQQDESSTNGASVNNTGGTDQNGQYGNYGYGNGYNNQYNNQQQQGWNDQNNYENNQWPNLNDNQWPWGQQQQQQQQNRNNVLTDFIQHSGNNVLVNSLFVNKQRKYVTQISRQWEEQTMDQTATIDLAIPIFLSGTQADSTSTDPSATGTSQQGEQQQQYTSPSYTNSGGTGSECSECGQQQQQEQQYYPQVNNANQLTYAAFQFNFNNVIVRNKNVQIAVIIAAQCQLEAEAQAQGKVHGYGLAV